MVADYAFLRNHSNEDVATVLVVKVLPYKVFFSCVVDAKGVDEVTVQRLSQLFKDLGLVHFVYRSDKEPAIRAMIEQAIILAGRSGKAYADADPEEQKSLSVMEELDEADGKLMPSPLESERILVAVPEHSMPGESKSNGIAERAVQQLEDHLRTLKSA